MKLTSARLSGSLVAVTMVLLPTQIPSWLDTATPVHSEPLRPALRVVRGTVARNSTLASILHGTLPAPSIHGLVQAVRPVYDLARLSAGQPFGVVTTPDGLLHAFTYAIDEVSTLRVSREGEAFRAEVLKKDLETRVVTVGAEIESSLFAAMETTGEGDQLALDLAEVFSYDVDFNTEVQKGDTFKVAVERLEIDGKLVRYGRILAAEFRQGARAHRAVRFDGGPAPGYFSPDGSPLRKAFLRSPLKFSRISSRFTRARFHPILNVSRPHLGVDYAAATGTPVMAAAHGTVVLAGWQGGFGRTVRIRHSNGYETLYGHLSRIDVRNGQRVSQGDRVGAVGSSGLATGPHLDYRMSRHGVFLDPLRIQSPPADPVAPADRPAFVESTRERMALLDGILPAGTPVGPQMAAAR